ncbi:MAG: IS5/IS1182 family transposase, partial [Thermoproteota archaeon]
GLKTSNTGEYRQFKYGDLNAKRKKYLVVIITADVKKKKLLYLEHIQEKVDQNQRSQKNRLRKIVKDIK